MSSWPIAYLDKPMTRCVHFVRTSPSRLLETDLARAKGAGVKFGYWSYLDGGRDAQSIASPLAGALGLEHAPYGGLRSWVEFLDDLITFAYRYDGLAIVVDRADLLLGERPDELFECVEAYLHQYHHWYDQKKPCHLVFQMAEDQQVTKLFAQEARITG
jgi:hypothetical protein